MKVTPTAIPEVLIVEPQVFGDERGFAEAPAVMASKAALLGAALVLLHRLRV